MNRKTHVFLLLSLLLFILYLCKDKIIHLVEPFGNQIIIHPDGSFNPQETTFSVLTYDKDIDSGYTQVGTCSDDNSWTKGDKTCRDYSLTGSNCDDIGIDGRSALEACKVACDNCIKYEPIKRRLPSPVEDTEEPSYAQFEDSDDNFGGTGGGGADFREVMNRLDEINQKMEMLSTTGDVVKCVTGVNDPPGCTPEKCTASDTPYVGCDGTCTAAGRPYHGCTQAKCTTGAETPYLGCDTTCTGVDTPYVGCIAQDCTAPDTPYQGCTEIVGKCSGNTDTANDITCDSGYRLLNNSNNIDLTNDPTQNTATCCELSTFCTNYDGLDNGDVSCPAGTPGADAGWVMPAAQECTNSPCDMSTGSSDVAMCCENQ